MDLQGKTVLVTGGGVRLGRAISLAFARQGASLAIHYHESREEAAQTAAEARAWGVAVHTFSADLSEGAAIAELCLAVEETCGGVDVLVNNASYLKTTPFPDQNPERWRKILAVLVDAPYALANALGPGMQARGEGAIVNILDLSIWQAWPNFTAHSVGKSGLLALTRQLALELAPSVRVNAIVPGYILPPAHYTAEKIDAIAQKTLLKRWGKAEDVAEAAVFLSQAAYITGAVLTVDGGAQIVQP